MNHGRLGQISQLQASDFELPVTGRFSLPADRMNQGADSNAQIRRHRIHTNTIKTRKDSMVNSNAPWHSSLTSLECLVAMTDHRTHDKNAQQTKLVPVVSGLYCG
jgi:hypothetical protein